MSKLATSSPLGGSIGAAELEDTAVTPGPYTVANFTVDQQGRLTAASSTATTGTGDVVRAASPTLTGAPVLAAPTATTLQTSGNAGVGVAPSGTNGQRLLVTQNGDQDTLAVVSNSEASGTAAIAGVRALADVAAVRLSAHGSGRTTTGWGEALGGWAEVVATTGDGLSVGTAHAAPLKLGTGRQSRAFVSGSPKTLTESSATAIADVTLANNTIIGGTLLYAIESNDAADYQVLRGRVEFSAVSKAGTITTTLGTPTEITTLSASTLTNTTTITTGVAKITLNLNAVSGLAQTTLRASFTVLLDGGTGSVIAV